MKEIEFINSKISEKDADGIIGLFRDKDIYLYGAGSYGMVLMDALSDNGIHIKGFIDRYASRIKILHGVDVYPTDILKDLDKNKVLIVLATNNEGVAVSMEDAIYQIRTDINIVKKGFELGRILQEKICSKRLEKGERFDLGKCVSCGSEDHDCEICIKYLQSISKPSLNKYGCRKYDRIGYIMGQFCTLRCRYCFEGVPRIPEPILSTPEKIQKDVQKFANGCYFLKYVELIGGEPFLHPKFKEILRGLLGLSNIGYIQIFTNATIVPDEELIEILKSPRIIIQVSDYYEFVNDETKKKIDKTKEIILREGIQHKFIANSSWMDMNDFSDFNKNEKTVEDCLKACVLANCHRLFDGILYKCPHQYAGVQQKKLDLIEGEYVDIHSYSDEELAVELGRMKDITYLDACRHCSIIENAVIVPPGEQMKIKEEQ